MIFRKVETNIILTRTIIRIPPKKITAVMLVTEFLVVSIISINDVLLLIRQTFLAGTLAPCFKHKSSCTKCECRSFLDSSNCFFLSISRFNLRL